LDRDRGRALVAFIEYRSVFRQTPTAEFGSGEAERTETLAQTEHDYVALVEVGAEAARLQTELERWWSWAPCCAAPDVAVMRDPLRSGLELARICGAAPLATGPRRSYARPAPRLAT